jgi:hypothetical protein
MRLLRCARPSNYPQDPEPHLTLSQVYADMRQFAQATEERETAAS